MKEPTKKPFFFEERKRTRIITFLVCFIIASIFWIFNSLSNDYTTSISYPVRLIYDKSVMTCSESATKKIDLLISGYGWSLLTLSLGLDNEPIFIKPADLNEERMIYNNTLLNLCKLKLKDVKINQVTNSFLFFDIDELISKKIALQLDQKKLSLPAGKTISDPLIEPKYITCSGPKNEILLLPDTINFSTPDVFIERTFSEYVSINYKPSRYISSSTDRVKVSFNVK